VYDREGISFLRSLIIALMVKLKPSDSVFYFCSHSQMQVLRLLEDYFLKTTLLEIIPSFISTKVPQNED
jgi:hypothetical protein